MGNEASVAIAIILFVIVMLVIAFVPAIIAYRRKHEYRHIILVLCIFSFTGILWLIAFISAVWPSEKSLADPVVGNVTGLGRRNMGDTAGAARYGQNRGYEDEAYLDQQSQRPSRQFRDPYAEPQRSQTYRDDPKLHDPEYHDDRVDYDQPPPRRMQQREPRQEFRPRRPRREDDNY